LIFSSSFSLLESGISIGFFTIAPGFVTTHNHLLKKCLSLNISTQVILTFRCHLQIEMLHRSLLQTFFLLRIFMTTLVIVAKSILTMKCYTLAPLHVSPIFLMLLVVVQQLFSCIFFFQVFQFSLILQLYVFFLPL
jgi:hypothetical protein